jgi:hypothetical protein
LVLPDIAGPVKYLGAQALVAAAEATRSHDLNGLGVKRAFLLHW